MPGMMIGSRLSSPIWRRLAKASSLKPSSMITAVGMPLPSRVTASCVQHDEHDPQPPTPTTAKSTSFTSSSIMGFGAGADRFGFCRAITVADAGPLFEQLADPLQEGVGEGQPVVEQAHRLPREVVEPARQPHVLLKDMPRRIEHGNGRLRRHSKLHLDSVGRKYTAAPSALAGMNGSGGAPYCPPSHPSQREGGRSDYFSARRS